AGDYNVQITATCDEDSDMKDSITVTVELNNINSMVVLSVVADRAFNPSTQTSVSFSFTVENTGNDEVTVSFSSLLYMDNVEISRTGWTINHRVGSALGSVNLDMEEIVTVSVDVTPSTSTLAGDYEIRTRVAITGSEVVLPFDLEILSLHDLSLNVLNAKLAFNAGAGEEKIRIQVTNDGNVDETVTISISSVSGGGKISWLTFPSPVSVLAGDNEIIDILVNVPSTAETKVYSFMVSVNATGAAAQTGTFELEVTGEAQGFFPGLSNTELGIILVVIGVVVVLIAVAAYTGKPPKSPKKPEETPQTPEEPPKESPEMRMNL
ncbi:MAG: hypothetical protein QCI38_08545, partial [Candidatus Thermoplasmatota archaeon]|nr:hypothetical protein [Candidatus Thermoplasmatota archaeon]